MQMHEHKETRPLRVLVVGTLYSSGKDRPGGCSVSLSALVEHLEMDETVDLYVVDTRGIRGAGLAGVFRFAKIVLQVLLGARRVDVVTLHCSRFVIAPFGLFHLVVARVLRKPLIVRVFAGYDCMAMGSIRGRLARFVVGHANLFLVQTKHLVNLARTHGLQNVKWFPTCREMHSDDVGDCRKMVCRRFVYVGQVREHKGIRELVEAAERLGDGIVVDVYGPLFNDVPDDFFETRQRVFYKGVLDHRDVISTMKQYDAFVLPTYHDGEGYPGAVLEAYSAGLPVIVTKWRAIPEIVDETSGILIEPRSVEALCHAMRRLSEDAALYRRLCRGARARMGQFESAYWNDQFVGFCRQCIVLE